MKTILLAALLVAAAVPALAQTQDKPAKLYASAAEMDAALAKVRATHKSGNTVEVLVSVGAYPVALEYRTAGTPPSLHKAQAELIYIVAGGCTLITGGALDNAKDGGANMSGTAITGGTPRKVVKGDYILVPSNTPHQYSDVQGELAMVTLHMPMAAQ